MTLCTARGTYGAGSELATWAWGRTYQPDASKRPVIYFTGANGDDRDFFNTAASGSQIAPRLVDVRIPFISAAFGSPPYAWGNDTSQTRIGQAWTQVKAALGTKTDKFVGIGVSKGATALLNYTRNNPANVAALLLIVPAVNVDDIYTNNRNGLATEIDTAYGGAGSWSTAKATHDPSLNEATHASQAIPMKLIYGDSDTTVIPSTVTGFASAVGASVITQAEAGKGHLDTAPTIDPVEDVLKFIAGYL